MSKLLIAIAAVLAIAATPGFAQPPVRNLNITSDSPPGWIPSEAQEASAREVALGYFAANDAGEFAQSYAVLTPEMKRMLSGAQHAAAGRAFQSDAGALVSRDITTVTWTKDPANAPRRGVYAAIDVVTRYANIDRHCGYIIAYQAAEGEPFMVMRTQAMMLTNRDAEQARVNGQDVDELWARLSRGACPNYSPAPVEER